MTKKEWNELDDEVKELVFKIAEEKDCSLDEAYKYIIAFGGALVVATVAMMF